MPLSGEDRLLHWLRSRLRGGLIGDDAVVLGDRGQLAITVDSQIEGVHYDTGLDPAHLARRLLAVNLSDLAAMGAQPAWALLALATARGFDHRRFFRSLIAACDRHGVLLAGGDLATSPRANVATLTLIGTQPTGGRWLRRSEAKPGHDLWLGGPAGESAAGRMLIDRGARFDGRRVELPQAFESPAALRAAGRRAVRRHIFPQPQLALGLWLGQQNEGAAMDVSDGVARDLRRLCRESGVGAEVEAGALPFAAGFPSLCAALGTDPLRLALGGGEDYVLLFTLPAGNAPPERLGAKRIGRITRSVRLVLQRDGMREELPDLGWDHLSETS